MTIQVQTPPTPTPQALAKLLAAAMHQTLIPVDRKGVKPNQWEVISDPKAQQVTISWIRETRTYSQIRVEFTVIFETQEAQEDEALGEWVHSSGLTGAVKKHGVWFPGCIRWATKGQPFDHKEFIKAISI